MGLPLSLTEILAMLQSQRSGPVVPLSAGGLPLGGRGPTLQEILNGARVANPGASYAPAPYAGGVRN